MTPNGDLDKYTQWSLCSTSALLKQKVLGTPGQLRRCNMPVLLTSSSSLCREQLCPGGYYTVFRAPLSVPTACL